MANQDTAPPVLTSLTLPSVIDVTSGDVTATFTAGATDQGGSGIDRVDLLLDHGIRSNGGLYGGISLFDSTDSYADGRSILSQEFDQTTAAGIYAITGAYVTDKAGNQAYYSRDQLTQLGLATSFQVKSKTVRDTTPPQLTSLMLPSVIDVTKGNNTATFTADASDGSGSGVDQVDLILDHGIRSNGDLYESISLFDDVDSFSDGRSNRVQEFDTSTAAGTYAITGAYVTDKAGNQTYYSRDQLTQLGIASSFQVKSNTVNDSTPPVLTSLTLPSVIDITNGNVTASFTAGATDQGSGVQRVSLALDHGFQSSGQLDNGIDLFDSSDSFSDGKSTRSLQFDTTTGAGTYNVTGAYVTDEAGNQTYYAQSQLTQLGFKTSFQVVDHNAPVTATITAAATVTEGADASAPLTLTLHNVTSASGTVSLAFDAADSTVPNGGVVSVPSYSSSYSVNQSAAGDYTIALPAIAIGDDLVPDEGGTIAVRIQVSGQVFDSGTDSTVVRIALVDGDQVGGAGADTLTGTPGKDSLSGGAGNDTLNGLGGNDVLDGGTGADTMTGGTGNDVYYVDNAGDKVVESGGGGNDTVIASVSYTLPVNVNDLTLAGSAAIAGTGNAADNRITGDGGNNVLDGGAGNDALDGGGGTDTASFASAKGAVTASLASGTASGAGNDTLANIENLTGSAYADTLTGSDGANALDGGKGADTMTGGKGNDVYYVDDAGDKVVEGGGGGNDTVIATASYTLAVNVNDLTLAGSGAIDGTGNVADNKITGNGGANALDGKGGNDMLTGGGGGDHFIFDSALGTGNIDTIADFLSGTDRLYLDRAVFKGISADGALAASAFTTGQAATHASDRIIYDTSTGALFYDPDGTGSAAAVQFATLSTHPKLGSGDIFAFG